MLNWTITFIYSVSFCQFIVCNFGSNLGRVAAGKRDSLKESLKAFERTWMCGRKKEKQQQQLHGVCDSADSTSD